MMVSETTLREHLRERYAAAVLELMLKEQFACGHPFERAHAERCYAIADMMLTAGLESPPALAVSVRELAA